MLRQRILAIYAHARSKDAVPRHQSCSPGADSWCLVKRAEAAGEFPSSHETKKLYLSGVSPDFLAKVFADLTETSLLSRCLRKETQNRNQSLHSKLWRKCLKIKFVYLQHTKFAASVSALEHNLGYNGNVLFRLGLIPKPVVEKEKRRLSTPAKPPHAKKRRVQNPDEPSTSYQPGGF